MCDNDPKEIKDVRLNIISMNMNDGVTPFFQPSEIMSELITLQRTWAQCCFRFKDKNGGS